MKLQNTSINKSGFTIVELLIVIVVIAILAAITIVAYNGITARANSSSAASNVESVLKIAEAFNADAGRYPGSKAQYTNGYTDSTITTASAKVPSSITILNPAVSATTTGTAPVTVSNATTGLTSSNGTSNVAVFITGTSAASTGGVIVSWDYNTNAVQLPAKYTYYGSASASSTFIALPN